MRSVLPGKSRRERPARAPLLMVGASRGIAEAFSLSVVLSLLAYASTGSIPDAESAFLNVLALGPLCAILCALRTRLRTGSRRGVFVAELRSGIVFAILVGLPGAVVIAVVMGAGSLGSDLLLLSLALWAWNLGAFAFFRGASYLWPRWARLRRSRLRWEMTHLILLAAAFTFAVFVLVFVAFVWLAGTLPARLSVLLPAVGVSVFLAVVSVGLVLPLAALFSYYAARGTARRLEDLAHGTSGLREGNFDVRVEVDGEDEVSELQRDFNAMADDLGAAVRDLRSERDNVERLLETQRELVASVSHELRTPVATMRGYLESALGSDGGNGERRLPGDVKSDLEVVGREVVRLQRLIDDLFVLSRAETGSLPLEIRPTDATALLSRCAEAASEGAWRAGRVEVIQTAEEDLPPVLADGGRLEQVVRNLISNAVRHTPPGGIVALSAAADADSVSIEVKDTGDGVAPDELEHVFERFYRSDGARKLDHAGAGLGLALVKELIEAMNGSVGAESEPGSGSRFVLRLPRA